MLEELRVELPERTLLLERVLPELLELERVEVPLERVLLLEELVVAVPLLLPLPFLRLVLLFCCTVPLERLELLLVVERVVVPLDRVELELLELEPVLVPLPFLRLPLCCWVVVLPPPERRDWARISGAMSMARASIKEAANVINLLIAQIVFKVNGINNTLGKAS